MSSQSKSHSPQDELYGPLNIPSYCWKIIDTPEFQRMRYILQLGTTHYIYPGATHTRFDHCMGCAHLASVFMEHLSTSQPELKIKPEWTQSIVIAALCHDLGHGPWSHCFEFAAEKVAKTSGKEYDHEEMSVTFLKHIHKKYHLDDPSSPNYISPSVIDAAGYYINGKIYEGYPKWLSQIVANKVNDIDIDKFDYLARDMNRSLGISRFEYDRLIVNCKVIDDQLCWKISEISTIDRLFFNRNDMHKRVYQHRVNQSITFMIADMLEAADPYLHIGEAIGDPEKFMNFDCRLLVKIESGSCGEEAQKLAMAIVQRKFYKCIGELRINNDNKEAVEYSRKPAGEIQSDIEACGQGLKGKIRVDAMKFRFGLTPNQHPLLSIPFYKPGKDEIIKLKDDDISCIIPSYFVETAMRVFVTDRELFDVAAAAFKDWKNSKRLTEISSGQ